jgi:ABC-type Fe3+-hydroxamate transport system substrate-binding protein
MTVTNKVHCDVLGRTVNIPQKPQRIVSLVSSMTETLFEINYGQRVAGVSSYCSRYVRGLSAPVVGDYLVIDEDKLKAIEPDLILMTGGIQYNAAKRLADKGFPVYIFPLPNSLHGILENVITLGALVDEMDAARALARRWERHFLNLESGMKKSRPRVYAELWLGKHARTPSGLTFIHDLIESAGGENIFGNQRQGYLPLNLEEVIRLNPDIMIAFSEPDYPVDFQSLLAECGWTSAMPNLRVIESNVTRGMNMIHDGPSMMETVSWLHKKILEQWN